MVLGTYLRENGKMIVSRMIPYWLTCVSAAWIVTFLYIWLVDAAYAWYDTVFGSKIFKNFGDEMIVGYGSIMVGLIVPLMSTASIAAFLVTKTPLPAWKFSWANKFFTMIRRFRADDAEYGRHLAKRNQFAKGEANFNLMAIWFVALPSLIGAFGYVPFTIEYAPISAEEHGVSEERMKWVHASAILGWGSIIAMSAFLIPGMRNANAI
ncbi:hypothetical protein MPSEU_000038200 [Mayamaea pseudoterrestris]|nr:hypothetical protein MPSEU_000038200 [Mayamaea pseudoterrestris]